MTPDEMLARLLYRDALMLVLDKPAGLAVHVGTGGGDTLERHFEALRFGMRHLPHLAHRLDRDTSGCLVLGRHPKALAKLGKLFAAGAVEKVYWAIAVGLPEQQAGRIDDPLKKVSAASGLHMVVAPDGQDSVTDYRVLGQAGGLSWIEFRPRTGRTHQIRVHAAALGCPLLGEPRYGAKGASALPSAAPLHLHARQVAIPLYPKREPVSVTAPVPDHMAAALASCGFAGDNGSV